MNLYEIWKIINFQFINNCIEYLTPSGYNIYVALLTYTFYVYIINFLLGLHTVYSVLFVAFSILQTIIIIS